MKSPAEQKCIQIELTNACPHGCSNCTRFTPHVKKPFFMEFETFRKAVKSLHNYTHMVGIMGGEPTLHPEFDRFVRHYAGIIPEPNPSVNVGRPIANFQKFRDHELGDIDHHRRGLWSSLGPSYARHFELIQEVFHYQCLNDHRNPGLHQALLIPRKELGLRNSDWVHLRDQCWIQNLWSSSISPKGAFFCEVAAALDMLFNGPGGWKIEHNWWMREPREFGDQLEWCELCSACLAVPKSRACDKLDIATASMVERLKAVGSPRAFGKRGKIKVFDPSGYESSQYQRITQAEPYLAPGRQRVSAGTADILRVRRLEALTVCENYGDYLRLTLPNAVAAVDRMLVVTTKQDKETQKIAKKCGAEVLLTDRLHAGGAPFRKGAAINDGLNALDDQAWVLILDADIILPESFNERIHSLILNPGCLYYVKRWGPTLEGFPAFLKDYKAGKPWHDLYWSHADKAKATKIDKKGNDIEHFPYGYFQLFHKSASGLAQQLEARQWYGEDHPTAEWADSNFAYFNWLDSRRISLSTFDRLFDVIHLPHGRQRVNWCGRKSPRIDK